jgi:transglutaminase-like putative cysteine protease
MRVELADRSRSTTERLYLRGVAYDRYNGRSWSNSFTHRRILPESAPGTFRMPGSFGRSTGKGSQKEGLRQDILLEALDTTVLFSVPFAHSISGEFLTVQGDVMGALYLPSPPTTRLEYTVVSHDNQLTEEDKSKTTFTYPDFVRAHFLQLPPISPQVTELAAHVTEQANTPYRKMLAIKHHLLEQYQYSLDVGSTLTVRPLEDFLFTRKTGYCEHYATAMVVLLRSIGIPARLVTGFLATEWNDFGNYYTVRQKDAHAWVEVFFPHSGWITVDPTPTIGESAPDLWWQSIGRMMDSVRLRWDRLIVQYSASDQLAVVQGIREGGDSLRLKISQLLTGWLNPLSSAMIQVGRLARQADLSQLAVLLALVMLGGAFFAVLIRQMIRSRRVDGGECPADQRAVIQVYNRMVDLLAAYGLTKAPSAAPIEFAKQVRRERNDAGSQVEALTQFYCRVRFGKTPLTREDLAWADQLLAQLRIVLRSSGSASQSSIVHPFRGVHT